VKVVVVMEVVLERTASRRCKVAVAVSCSLPYGYQMDGCKLQQMKPIAKQSINLIYLSTIKKAKVSLHLCINE
jgi:hypothetical protein